MKIVFLFLFTGWYLQATAQQNIWQLAKGDNGIFRNAQTGIPHTDHMEMSGEKIAAIITYGTDSAHHMVLKRKLIFPMLRTVPNDTRASLTELYEDNIIDSIQVGGHSLKEVPKTFYINGYLRTTSTAAAGLILTRTIFPSVSKAACIEWYQITNSSGQTIVLDIPSINKSRVTPASKGVYGTYVVNYRIHNAGKILLSPGQSQTFSAVFSARKESEPPYHFSADYEFKNRKALINGLDHSLILKTPNDTINQMFAFAKIRAAESIFDTRAGLMHSPGGGDYYAAIWANDEAEYVGPFFPFLGYARGNEAAQNSYRLFAGYMNASWHPIPSSIIAEGQGIWNDAGDRGDAAMIAYGASRFALSYADTLEARRLWPLIDWCLAYLQRRLTDSGVITSNTDELEGRFPAGQINLSTNTLAYAALTDAARLAKELGMGATADSMTTASIRLKRNIERYFGGNVQGFETYRYYSGNTTLRSWICLPLVMGIFDRKQQTIAALLSKYLWTNNGILTEAGSKTFWDRATLYAFRGLFYAGAADLCYPYFSYYSAMRLLGNHVPYAIEAWPEGDQRQLSAESGLYCRVITEGLFGIDPTGFHSFTMTPRLPAGWQAMSLHHIKAFGSDFDIDVRKKNKEEEVFISVNGEKKQQYLFNGRQPLSITL